MHRAEDVALLEVLERKDICVSEFLVVISVDNKSTCTKIVNGAKRVTMFAQNTRVETL